MFQISDTFETNKKHKDVNSALLIHKNVNRNDIKQTKNHKHSSSFTLKDRKIGVLTDEGS